MQDERGTSGNAGGFAPTYPESYLPRKPLSVFDGASGPGVWKLIVKDVEPGGKQGQFLCGRLFIDN